MLTNILSRLFGKSRNRTKKPEQRTQNNPDGFLGTTIYSPFPASFSLPKRYSDKKYEKPTITKVEDPEILKKFYKK